MYAATYETSSQIIENALAYNVYHHIVLFFLWNLEGRRTRVSVMNKLEWDVNLEYLNGL